MMIYLKWFELFLFILSSLIVLKYTISFILELISSEPNMLVLTKGELIMVAISIAYGISFIYYH